MTRRYYSRSSYTSWAAFFGAITGSAIGWFLSSWFAMLCIGAAHSGDARIPALGFGPVLWLGLALSVLVGSSAKAAK